MPQVYELAQNPGIDQISRATLFLARTEYDFAVDGGAVSDIALFGSTVIPSGALILAAFIHVITVPTSGGAATVALKSEGAADLQSAAAITGAPWSTAGFKAATQTFAADPVELTAARDISVTIATAALTAGKFEVLVYFVAPGLE